MREASKFKQGSARLDLVRVLFSFLALIVPPGNWLPDASVRAQHAATLRLEGPRQVAVGAPIDLILSVIQASDVAGYEAHLRFDATAVHFAGLRQRNNDLRRLGRAIGPLTVSELPDGLALGFYSCPTADCVTRRGPRQSRGGQGRLILARITLIPDRAGRIDLALGAVKLVDAAGVPVSVAMPTPTYSIQVGSLATSPAWPAPPPAWQLILAPPDQPVGPFDLTGDGLITHADAAEVALAWTFARERRAPCAASNDASRDINHDGCIDVADVQLIAAQYSNAGAAPAVWPRSSATFSATTALEASATWTVNTAIDSNDINIGDGICQASVSTSGKCTLRAAIQEANAHPGADAIAFALPGGGAQTITLKSTLPALSDASGPTAIDGYTQPGAVPNSDPLVSNAQLRVQIAGAGPSSFDALPITAPGNLVRGLAFFNLRRSFLIYGDNATDNVVVGDFIGTNATGSFGATTSVINASGLEIMQGATRTVIGGSTPAERNVISGNSRHGVWISYEGSDRTRILNNLIGLNPSGTARLPNLAQGVDLNAQSSFNIVGGTAPGERNVISGNALSGVEISHDTLTAGNQVLGNFIGTSVDGTASGSAYTYNSEWGVHIEDGANNNLVIANVIGNNRLGGVQIEGYNTIANQVRDNRIGIGVDGSAIGNSRFGVRVKYHAGRSRIGPGNIISHNPIGVDIEYLDEDFNTITRNEIAFNTSLGINLGPSPGVSYNDSGDGDSGANDGLNFPVLSAATPYQVKGTACAEAVVARPCTIEVFVAAPLASDQGGGRYGQGRKFAGSGMTASDGTFTVALRGVVEGDVVTATATDATGNTSEFSANRVVGAGGPPSATATPTAPPVAASVLVADGFSRQVHDGWGSADIGEGWALEAPSRPAVDYDVNGNQGTMTSNSAAQWHGAYQPTLSAQEVDMRVRFETNTLASGGYGFVYIVARRVAASTQYLGRLVLDSSGNAFVQAARTSGNSSALTMLGKQIRVEGVRHTPNSGLWLRGQIVGVQPTTIRLKAWADGQAEPAGWNYTVTDSTPELQAPGAVGLRTYVSAGVTALPFIVAFDDVHVTAGSAPTATATATPTQTAAPTRTATPTPARTATPSPTTSTATTYAADTFGRQVIDSWGQADVGGNYTVSSPAANFDVNGAAGTILIPAANTTRWAYLSSVSARDVDVLVRSKVDRLATGGSQILYLAVRRQADGTEYRGRLRFDVDGRLMLVAERVEGGAVTILGGEKASSGRQVANSYYWLHFQAFGSNPTTLRLKAWVDGQAEPVGWQYSTTDSLAMLQASGAVGVRAYLSGGATNAPVTFAFDDYRVAGITNP